MKTIRFIMISCALVLAAAARAQQRNYTLRATVGTGIALDVPATTPVLTQFIAATTYRWAMSINRSNASSRTKRPILFRLIAKS